MKRPPEPLADGAPAVLAEPRRAHGGAMTPDAALTAALLDVVWTAHRARPTEQRLPTRHVDEVVRGTPPNAERGYRAPFGQPRLERRPSPRELGAVVGQHPPDEKVGEHRQVGAAFGVWIEERRRGGARVPSLAREHRAIAARRLGLGRYGSAQELARPPRIERRQDVGLARRYRGPARTPIERVVHAR